MFPLLPSIALVFLVLCLFSVTGENSCRGLDLVYHCKGKTNKNVLAEIDVFSILETEGKREEEERDRKHRLITQYACKATYLLATWEDEDILDKNRMRSRF